MTIIMAGIIHLALKKFLNPFCFACTLGLLPCYKAKRVQLNGKTLQVLKTSLPGPDRFG